MGEGALSSREDQRADVWMPGEAGYSVMGVPGETLHTTTLQMALRLKKQRQDGGYYGYGTSVSTKYWLLWSL
jgi:hypothetical protein